MMAAFLGSLSRAHRLLRQLRAEAGDVEVLEACCLRLRCLLGGDRWTQNLFPPFRPSVV